MNSYLGELAALATSLMFSISSTILAMVSKQVGPLALNRLRLVLAVGWLLLAHLLLRTPLPLHPGATRVLWLSISGVLGLVVGDLFLFQAYIYIGARLTMLLMALSPALAALAAWLMTGETLQLIQIAGIALTLAGIIWVVRQRQQPGSPTATAPVSPTPATDNRRHYLYGVLCGLAAACGQALGLVTARLGLTGDFSALSGTLIRMLAAMLALWAVTLVTGQAGPTVRLFARYPRAVRMALGGSFFGPFAGVTLSLYAVQHTAVGVASTLTSLAPIILLPMDYFLFKERFGWQAVAGTLLAMAGVVLLFVT